MKTLIILAALMLQSGAFQYACVDQEGNRLKLEVSEDLHVGDTVSIDSFLQVIEIRPKQLQVENQNAHSIESEESTIELLPYERSEASATGYGPPTETLNRENQIFTKVDIRAEYPGGEAAFRDYVKYEFIYPSRCRSAGIDGTANLRFIVDKTGRISDIEILSEMVSCPEFTQEAIRVLEASKRWIPAQINGHFVTARREIIIKMNAF